MRSSAVPWRKNGAANSANFASRVRPSEAVPNVRLHARKALQALAGHVDYGYDVGAWRKAFERGPTIGRHIFYSRKPEAAPTQLAEGN